MSRASSEEERPSGLVSAWTLRRAGTFCTRTSGSEVVGTESCIRGLADRFLLDPRILAYASFGSAIPW